MKRIVTWAQANPDTAIGLYSILILAAVGISMSKGLL